MHHSESRLAWLLALSSDPDPVRIAETHGLVTGLVCAAPLERDAVLVDELLQLNPPAEERDDLAAQLQPAIANLKQELASSELDFRLLLPTDERDLEERTACLATWTSGFLAGFGTRSPGSEAEDAVDALRMLEQIARASMDPEETHEVQETALSELSEFVRVAVLLLREHGLRAQPQ